MGQNCLYLGIVTAYRALQKRPVNFKCQVFLILSELSNPELCKFCVLPGLKACFEIRILDFFRKCYTIDTQWDVYVPQISTCCPQGTARLLLFSLHEHPYKHSMFRWHILVSHFHGCCRYRRKNPMWQNAAACIWTSPTATVNKDQ